MSDLDLRLKEMDVEEKRSKLDAMKCEWGRTVPWWSNWNNPVALAVLAAIIGYLGTLLTWSLANQSESDKQEAARKSEANRHVQTLAIEEAKQKATERLEQQRLQGTLILDAIKTEGTEKTKRAAINLLLLADAKLVTFEPAALEKLDKWSRGEGGVGPGLPSNTPTLRTEPLDEKAYEKIRFDAEYAVSVLNVLFGRRLGTPSVKPTEFGDRNAYADIDTKTIHVPPAIQYIPEITYREVAHLYRPMWEYDGESGALGTSFADILASVVKQRRLGQTAQTADWVLYPRAVAWLAGEDLARSTDITPLRSLKAPGTAFDKDRQVSHMKNYVKKPGGLHDNSGIPSKAFYEAAMKLGTDKAGEIWVKSAIAVPGPRPTFAEFAREAARQAEVLQGADARKGVLAAWETVGVAPAK